MQTTPPTRPLRSRRFNCPALLVLALACLTGCAAAARGGFATPPPSPDAIDVFMRNSGWCWFQDPRAIIHDNKVVIGGVEGNGGGAAAVGVYDLSARKILGRTIVNPDFDRDDHNSPVFLPLPDGRLLTVYARHHRDRLHRYRFSTSDDLLSWTDEKHYKHDYDRAGNVTYMNLYRMADEGRIYNFYRGIAFNPSFITSTDNGRTWQNPTHFIQNEVSGRQRPYTRYAGNGKDTVHISFTDAHPRDFGNSIYYAAFRGGSFYRADGSLIKHLHDDGPLRPSEAERVFKGGGGEGRGRHLSAQRAAWTSSIQTDEDGHPHMAYSLYLANDDQRYRIASWNGQRWIDREVAFAGSALYPREASYTGLIALDPADPTYAVLSTDADPSTGQPLGGGRHAIYRGRVHADDDIQSIDWQRITPPSDADNLRPMILRDGDQRVVLWQRGRFDTFIDYNLDTVGYVESAN